VKILITGVTGFVGRSLAKSLASQEKYTVVGLSRSDTDLPVECLNIGDLTPRTNYNNLLQGFDVVIHLAARVHQMQETSKNPLSEFRYVNCATTLNLAKQSCSAGVKRFIFLSSIKVCGEFTYPNKPFRPNDTIDLNSAFIKKKDPYAVSKLECERALQSISKNSMMGIVIIRPPLIYGKGAKGNFSSLLNLTKLSLPIPLGGIENKRSFVFVKNLVSLIIHAAEHPNANGGIFLVSDDKDISISNLIHILYTQSGKKAKLFKLPQSIFKLLLNLIGKKGLHDRLFKNLQVDISATKKELGWTPPYSLEDGIYETIHFD
jgi:nucleoside-diphosphate-sugar epimerase